MLPTSELSGVGLFAVAFVERSTAYWMYRFLFDIAISMSLSIAGATGGSVSLAPRMLGSLGLGLGWKYIFILRAVPRVVGLAEANKLGTGGIYSLIIVIDNYLLASVLGGTSARCSSIALVSLPKLPCI